MTAQTQLNLTAMNAALKELYDDQTVQNLVYSDNPLMAMVPKKTNFGGKNKPIPIIIAASQGRSANFSNAQTNKAATEIDAFALTRAKDYSLADIDNETMLSSQTDKMAFLEGAKVLIDGAFRSIVNSAASALFRAGTGSIGAIGSIASGVITLSNAEDVVQFERNMVLQANATDGGASPRAALGYVIAVNRSAGTVTVSDTAITGTAASPSGWTAADFLLVQGDNNAKISGLAAWVPAAAPGATAFFGVDRSVDPTRLGGVRYDGSAQSVEEAFIDAASLVGREGGMPDCAFVNFTAYSALEKALGSKVQYVDLKGPAEISFRGIMINGPKGPIKIIPDRNQKPQVAHLIQMNTWCLESLGDCPQILRYGDGLEMLRLSSSDAGEVRIGYYGNLRTNAPGWNCHVDLGV